MALAYTKAGWNFEKYLYAYAQSVELGQRNWWFGFKDTLVRLGWEVRGGYSSTGGLAHNTAEAFGAWGAAPAQSDPWATVNDCNRTGGNDMYIILRSPTGFEICMGSNYTTQATYMFFTFMYISHNDGFGAVNGGVDGTGGGNSVIPTATDRQTIYVGDTNGVNNDMDVGSTFSIYGAQSTDNNSTRLVIQKSRGIHVWFSFEHLDNPHANLDNGGRVFAYRVVNSEEPINSPMSNVFYTSALYYGRVAGINRTLYTGTSGYANLGHQSLNIVQADNKMVVAPMDLYNNTLGEKGYYGTIPDLYYGNNEHYMVLLGDSVGGPPNWFSGGSIVSPWDGDILNAGANPEPLPRVH